MIRTAAKPHSNIRIKNKFPYEIAIPTMNNPVLLRDTTLNILKAYRVPTEKITIFVPSESQERIYKSILLPNTYGKMCTTFTSTLADHYNRIYTYYTPGTQVVFIKDCIQSILESNPVLRPLQSFLGLCKLGFGTCKKEEARLWGLCPTVATMKQTITSSLQHIPGNLWGTILPMPSAGIHLTQDHKEDYERSIQYYKADNAVVRLNMVCAVECKQQEDLSGLRTSIHALLQNYPEYIAQKKTNPLSLQFRAQNRDLKGS